MTLSAEDQTFITQLRLRSLPGATEPPTLEEMKKAIIILRCKRSSAAEANAASGKKAAKKGPSASAVADALADLDSV
jgi:hypothetical protein